MRLKLDSFSRAVFLDRDGVLIHDVDLLTDKSEVIIPPDVPKGLYKLGQAGYKLIVISNQTVVARGMATESKVEEINTYISNALVELGAPKIDAFYICPHHPHADVQKYRVACECRKPKPGLLIQAAAELRIDLSHSFMIGDRMSDIIAGSRAGCKTVLTCTGKHDALPIISDEPFDTSISPHFTCDNFHSAVNWILQSISQ